MLEWLKQNVVTVFLGALVLWMLSQRLGWFQSPEVDDPSSPLRHFTAATWNAEVLQSDKPVLVDFWASWCMPCRAQGPIVSGLAKELSGTAVVGKLDVEAQGALAAKYGISGIPSLLIFRKGRVVEQFTGVTSAGTLKSALEKAALL